MTAATKQTLSVLEQIQNLRTQAERAKKEQNFELAFELIDQADTLEAQEL